MVYKIYLFESGEQEYVAAASLEEAIAHAKEEIDCAEEGLDDGSTTVRELTLEEALKLEIRVSEEPDKYEPAFDYIKRHIEDGSETLPFFFMASYF